MKKEISKEETQQIVDLIEVFESINPVINYGNRGHRTSATKLIKHFGVEMTMTFARASVAVAGKPYAPTITNPTELLYNVAKLRLYLIKQKEINKVGGRGCVGNLENVINSIKK